MYSSKFCGLLSKKKITLSGQELLNKAVWYFIFFYLEKKRKTNLIWNLLEIEKMRIFFYFKETVIIIYVAAFNTWDKIEKTKIELFIPVKIISFIRGTMYLNFNYINMCPSSPWPSGRGLCPGTPQQSQAPDLPLYASGCTFI